MSVPVVVDSVTVVSVPVVVDSVAVVSVPVVVDAVVSVPVEPVFVSVFDTVEDVVDPVVSEPVVVVVVVVTTSSITILPSLAITWSEISVPFVSYTFTLSMSTGYSPGAASAGIANSSSITVLPFSDLT